MNAVLVTALRALLIVMLLGAVFAQVRFLPVVVARDIAEAGAPELAVLYPALGIAAIVCAEAVLLAIWMLLAHVRRQAIFDRRAFRWVDLIIGAGIVATCLGIAFALILNATSPEVPPGILGLIAGAVIANLAFVLLMVVMRGLLRAATGLRAELDEVV